MQPNDEQLMMQCRKGSISAFERLIHRWDTRMFTYFMRCVGNREEAEDLRQELFLRLYRKRKSFKAAGNFQGWLYRIATNLVIDHCKKNRKHTLPTIEECPEPFMLEVQGNETIMNDIKERIERALNAIDAEKRVVLVLHHFENMTCREIASSLNIPLHTAKNRLYRGLEQLRIELKKVGIYEVYSPQEV